MAHREVSGKLRFGFEFLADCQLLPDLKYLKTLSLLVEDCQEADFHLKD
jgi:hypothetical protein